ncbi:G2/M phase-specific E3 ubiquitin-protein ligase [Larimichthys crocea]|uniref:HECT-type E3 ubiquitin transferase n=1 Tax=Larimichthys crocea TaxID=215358 RepID=A0A6G0JAE2_LARCR|nr:G2/M phase-specific E3 ubiquitin-protein ligase [Larimichthys crocea]
MKEGCDSSTEEDDWVEEEDMFVPATAVAQASCSTEQKAQASSSQPSTSDQTPNCWPYSRPHLYAPATAVAQASCSTQQEVQMFSSQPSTSDQTPNRWPDPRPQVYAPATAVAQASCSTQQKAQASSSQPSTRDQTPSQCQNDYGTYIDLIHETSDEDNDDDLYSAIIASIEDQTQPKEDIPISQILNELSDKIDSLQVCKFNINRSAVLDGAIRGFRRLSYDPNKKMSVKFSDDRGTTEEAVDLGGPRREFLRLLMETLAESDMFEGPEGHLNLALSSSAVREDRYFIAGRAIAVSLVHGGPPPCFLSRTLFACIAEGPDGCRPVLEDITDMELYSKLKQISEAKTLEELRQFTEPLTDYLATAGCLRHLTSLVDKDKLLEDVLMFQVVQRVRGPLERFSDGLGTLGVLQKIKHHPEAFRPVLCYSPGTLTAEIMDHLFAIRWSEMGSNNRAHENRVVAYWRDYLQDAEEDEGPPKLGDILSFATGCDVMPPIGFSPKPSLEFQRGRYPIANTCVNCLRIPLHQSYEDFKSNMDFAIRNTQGFGME